VSGRVDRFEGLSLAERVLELDAARAQANADAAKRGLNWESANALEWRTAHAEYNIAALRDAPLLARQVQEATKALDDIAEGRYGFNVKAIQAYARAALASVVAAGQEAGP
jgi:hypothetical protein